MFRFLLVAFLVVSVGQISGCASAGGGGGGNVVPTTAAPTAPDTTYLSTINASAAWNKGLDGHGVVVADLDSGIRRTHQEFSNATVLAGYNTHDNNTDTSPANYHGTVVASIIVGKTLGVAPKASLLPIRMTAPDGSLTTTDETTAIDYAANVGAQIINISASTNNTMTSSLESATTKGCLLVLAAGNTGASNPEPWTLYDPTSPLALSAAAQAKTLVVGGGGWQ